MVTLESGSGVVVLAAKIVLQFMALRRKSVNDVGSVRSNRGFISLRGISTVDGL
jgi:hypothetical protein